MLQAATPTPVPVPASGKGLAGGAVAGIAIGAGAGIALALGMYSLHASLCSVLTASVNSLSNVLIGCLSQSCRCQIVCLLIQAIQPVMRTSCVAATQTF